MRLVFAGVLLALVAGSPALAQNVSAVEVQIERLRSQLRDVVDREAQLQERAARLDEDLRPESIERSVAGTGSTDAAALRARRREQLEREKADLAGQLSETSAKRARLEAEIAAAEAEAVRLKAASLAPRAASPGATPAPAPAAPSVSAPTVEPNRRRGFKRRRRGRTTRRLTPARS